MNTTQGTLRTHLASPLWPNSFAGKVPWRPDDDFLFSPKSTLAGDSQQFSWLYSQELRGAGIQFLTSKIAPWFPNNSRG
jgi:hypothetical protein